MLRPGMLASPSVVTCCEDAAQRLDDLHTRRPWPQACLAAKLGRAFARSTQPYTRHKHNLFVDPRLTNDGQKTSAPCRRMIDASLVSKHRAMRLSYHILPVA